MIKKLGTIALFILVLLGLTHADDIPSDCDHITDVKISTRATLKSCSGWALNRLPVVKNWIKERAQGKEFKDTVTIDYVGGDPRFVFSTTYDKLCVKNGLVVRTLGF